MWMACCSKSSTKTPLAAAARHSLALAKGWGHLTALAEAGDKFQFWPRWSLKGWRSPPPRLAKPLLCKGKRIAPPQGALFISYCIDVVLLKNSSGVASSILRVLEARLVRRLKRARLSRIEELADSIRCVCALVTMCGSVTP